MGISADNQATQLKFVEKFGLTFPVIPDTEKDIIDAYGAREVLGVTAKRSTFLIGPDGTISAHLAKREGRGARRGSAVCDPRTQ